MSKKQCRACGVSLVVGENWTPGTAKGNRCICQKCVAIKGKSWYKANKEEQIKRMKAYYQANKERYLRKSKNRYYANKKKLNAQRRACQKKRRGILRRYKQMKGCIICGDHNATHLVFHAPDGHRDAKVSSLAGRASWSRIKTEVFYCIVVCANCHMDIHAGEVKLPPKDAG